MLVVNAMLSNAAVAAGLALLALAVSGAVRRPVIRHAAWLVVLLKLVTPPLIAIPLMVLPSSWNAGSSAGELQSFVLTPAEEKSASAPIPETGLISLAEWALMVWAAGSVGWFAWQGRKVLRFRRRVARAEEASREIAEAARQISASLGLKHLPIVKVTSGIGSPMLWGWGRHAIVLFPRELLVRLSPEARDTLLAHELVHFLRRDHWVRMLEFFATGLYWWHPAVWLARMGIESAEEECCDAWVVGGLSASPRRYAEALLATVDFEAELRRPTLPPAACAANRSARLLRRRLFGIIHSGPPRRLPAAPIFWSLAAAALLMRPVLKPASAEVIEASLDSSALVSHQQKAKYPPRRSVPRDPAQPQPWATAAAPNGGIVVEARERDFIIRHPDGSVRTLGPGRPIALAYSPTASRIATVGPGTLLRTWDEHAHKLAETNMQATARAIAYTPDGSKLLALDAEGGISIHNPYTLAVMYRWYLDGPANSICCSPDSGTIAVSFGSWLGERGWVECWSIAEGRKVACIPAASPVGACRFTPDGKTLIIGGWNGLVAWRSLPGGQFITDRQLSKDLVATAAFCPDSGTLPLVPPVEIAPPPVPVFSVEPDFLRESSQAPDR